VIYSYSHLRDRLRSHPGKKQLLIFDLKIGKHVSDFIVINDPAVVSVVEVTLGGGDGELVDNNVAHWLVVVGHRVEGHDVVGVGADETTEETSGGVGDRGGVVDGEVETAVVVRDLDGESRTVLDVDLDGLVVHLVVVVDDEVDVTVGLDAGERIGVGWSALADAGVVNAVEVEGEVGALRRGEVDGGHSGLLVFLALGSMSSDREGGRGIDQEVHLGVWARGVIEADRLLAFGVDHEVGITVGIVVVAAVVVIVVVVVVVVVVGVVLLLALLVVVVFLGKDDSWDDGEKLHDVKNAV